VLLVGAFSVLLVAGPPGAPSARRWGETVVRWGRLIVFVAIGYKIQSKVIDRGMRGSEQNVAIRYEADDLSPRLGGADSRVSRDGQEAHAPHGASPTGLISRNGRRRRSFA